MCRGVACIILTNSVICKFLRKTTGREGENYQTMTFIVYLIRIRGKRKVGLPYHNFGEILGFYTYLVPCFLWFHHCIHVTFLYNGTKNERNFEKA